MSKRFFVILVIAFASTLLAMFLMVSTGAHQNIVALRFMALGFVTVLSVTVTASYYLLKNRNKYWQFREAYYWTFQAGEFSRAANKRLLQLAKEVRGANEEILLFQSNGLRAFQERPWYRGKSYKELDQELQKNFKGKQEFFYRMYNVLKAVEDLAFIDFDADNWKGYAGEPQVPKIKAS